MVHARTIQVSATLSVIIISGSVTYNHYSVAWAYALDTPFQPTKGDS